MIRELIGPGVPLRLSYLDPRRWEALITPSDPSDDDPDLPWPRSDAGLTPYELHYLTELMARRLAELADVAKRLDGLSSPDPPSADAPERRDVR